jgi:HSP20 family protein
MANINVRKNDKPQAPLATREWDPSRWMRTFFSWDPFQEMVPFASTPEQFAFDAAFDVKETKDAYLFKADVPGIKQGDIDVNLTGNRLTISGKRESEKKEEKDTYYAYERSYGSFTRAFTLPEGIDGSKITADLRDGVLTIAVPKLPEVQPKKIAVKTPEAAPKA